MNCIVTAGPSYEPLDEVRRLTNFSSGGLGTELANYLGQSGHQVTLLIGEQATHRGKRCVLQLKTFTTTADLCGQLQALASDSVGAVFHAAAVSDFRFGKVWSRPQQGQQEELKSGKISSRQGTLLAELLPTPKIITELRGWFPAARLVGWKYEVAGDRASVIRFAEEQLGECRTDACVANGRAYGDGFGLVTGAGKHAHLRGKAELFDKLENFIRG